MEIFESILKGKNRNLTKTQQRILTYMMDNFDETIFLNASKIAQKTEVSESSVIRLAQALGFDGYPSMQRELQRHSYYRLSMVNRLAEVVKKTRDEQDIFVKVMQEDISNLTETLKDISIETFNKAVSEIWSARHVYVLGIREEYAPALVLANSLKCFMKTVKLLEPKYGDIWDDVFGIEKGDLIIGIGFPRYVRLTVDILKYANERGAKVGIITDSLVSPLTQHADWVLPAKCKMESFYITFISAMSIINALITALSLKNTEKNTEVMKERELLWKQKKFYYHRP